MTISGQSCIIIDNYSVLFSAIGRKVNMAARLMMHYPSMVTCDNETFHHSKLPSTAFEPLEIKQMKGLRNVGTIREFLGAEGWVDSTFEMNYDSMQ